jgi:hypothetical protein
MAASSEVVDRGRSRQSRSYSCRPKEARADIQEAIPFRRKRGSGRIRLDKSERLLVGRKGQVIVWLN